MKLNAPTQIVWIISVVLGVIGILANFVDIPNVSPYAFWLLTVGFVVLVVSTLIKGA